MNAQCAGERNKGYTFHKLFYICINSGSFIFEGIEQK